MTAAIETCGLVKRFGATRALDGLDLTVDTGEVHGFVGPNGAGKRTTLRVLLPRRRCWAAIRGATRSPSTAGSRACRAK